MGPYKPRPGLGLSFVYPPMEMSWEFRSTTSRTCRFSIYVNPTDASREITNQPNRVPLKVACFDLIPVPRRWHHPGVGGKLCMLPVEFVKF